MPDSWGELTGTGPATASASVLLVLAAGASTRHGGRPKALLEIDSVPAVVRIIRAAREAGVHEAVVVVGAHEEPITAALAGERATVVVNETWELGRTGSVLRGLSAIPAEANVLLWPVDHPFAESNIVRRIETAAMRDTVAAWIVPTFEGHGGHPVWMAPPARRMVQSLAPDTPLRSVLPRLGVQVLRLPVDDASVLASTDTPEEYRAALDARRR